MYIYTYIRPYYFYIVVLSFRMLPDIVGIGHQLLHRRVPEEGAWVEAPQLMLPTTEEPDCLEIGA